MKYEGAKMVIILYSGDEAFVVGTGLSGVNSSSGDSRDGGEMGFGDS